MGNKKGQVRQRAPPGQSCSNKKLKVCETMDNCTWTKQGCRAKEGYWDGQARVESEDKSASGAGVVARKQRAPAKAKGKPTRAVDDFLAVGDEDDLGDVEEHYIERNEDDDEDDDDDDDDNNEKPSRELTYKALINAMDTNAQNQVQRQEGMIGYIEDRYAEARAKGKVRTPPRMPTEAEFRALKAKVEAERQAKLAARAGLA